MANNVFGDPVDDDLVKTIPPYDKEGYVITRKDRAHVALNMKNADDRNTNAYNTVKAWKAEYGDGVSTLCLVFNATGDPVTLVGDPVNWEGMLWEIPVPHEIANGQWGAFLHVKPHWPNWHLDGSAGGIVYRGLNNAGVVNDFMCSWYNPWEGDNHAYTMIREKDHFVGSEEWNQLKALTKKSGLNGSDEWNGCVANVTIGSDTTSLYEARISLEGAEEPPSV